MKINISIPYQEENSSVIVISKILIGLIIIGLLILILSREIIIFLFLLLFVVLEVFNINRSHGRVNFEVENKSFRFQVKGSQNCVKQISTHQFSWNYVHLESFSPGGDGVSTSTGHTNFIQLKIEMTDTDNQKIVVIQELYPWQDLPKNWYYKVLDDSYNQQFRVKNGLIDLKKRMTYT